MSKTQTQAWINSDMAYNLFEYQVARSVMAYAYRNSNIKTMKRDVGKHRFDPIANYDVEEILKNMSVSIHSRKGNAKSYWKDDYENVKVKLQGLILEQHRVRN